MPVYTFVVPSAAVDVEAENEFAARQKYRQLCLDQQEDVDYNGMTVYLPSWSELTLNGIEED